MDIIINTTTHRTLFSLDYLRSKGVASFIHSEGARCSPGSPSNTNTYLVKETHLRRARTISIFSEFVQSIDDLMCDSNSNASQPRKGVVSGLRIYGYMDDLQWAAPSERMLEVIKFVRERGPAYGADIILTWTSPFIFNF